MSDYSDLDMEELWLKIQREDTVAIGEIIRRFEPLIRKMSRINGKYDEDIAQDIRETLVRAVKKEIRSQKTIEAP